MKKGAIIAIAIGVAVALGIFSGVGNDEKEQTPVILKPPPKIINDSISDEPPLIVEPVLISSFEDCVAAGNPVMESYPRQCRTSDGKHFVEKLSGFEVIISGKEQVRRGTTHTIQVQVFRDGIPVDGARVFLDIEDYGEDIIKEFDGYTNPQGVFLFSWEIPQSFDDIETLFAIVDVTDDISSKTERFRFQVYCLPGESDCKVKGN